MQPEDLDRAGRAAVEYVDAQMTGADLVAVATIDTALNVIADFTGDRQQVKEALAEFTAVDGVAFQGPELIEAVSDLEVPFLAVVATHDTPASERAHALLPAALWAECDGSFTNYQRRVQRFKAAVPAPGEARPRWEIAAELLRRLGGTLEAATARELFVELAKQVPDYAGLSPRSLGASGHALAAGVEASA
jgi:NADH dehydrogenase/NADH:ubiquinone oxidoreductase subunit G